MVLDTATMATVADAEVARGGSGALLRRSAVRGPVLFARYAFGPNRLGLCGPEDWRALLELGVAAAASETTVRDVDRGLRELAAGFEGAFPYLQLIATANGIEDALDPRVVDAYWIGSSLSDHVGEAQMTSSLDERFHGRLGADAWRWLASRPAAGARPTHAFHVLDVFPRVGLMSGEGVGDALGLMDQCRIRWGRVLEVAGERLVVDIEPLHLQGGKLVLGPSAPVSVRRWLDGAGFVDDVAVGETVSVHWDWACEVLDRSRLRSLQWRTMHQMGIANQTI